MGSDRGQTTVEKLHTNPTRVMEFFQFKRP